MKIAVICDFDGTAAVGIVARLVLNELSLDLRAVTRARQQFLEGSRTFRSYQECAFRTLPPDGDLVASTAWRTGRMRAGFGELSAAVKRADGYLNIVSSGFDLYIDPVLQKHGYHEIEVNSANASCSNGWEFNYPNRKPDCRGDWATCKCAVVNSYRQRGCHTIFVGDEIFADACAAQQANTVFGSRRLWEKMRSKGKPVHRWDDNLMPVANFIEQLQTR